MFRKSYLLLLSALVTMAQGTFAQSDCRRIIYNQVPTSGFPDHYESGQDVMQTAFGNWFLLGDATINTDGERDITITKLDASGNTVWMKAYDLANTPPWNPYGPYNVGQIDYGNRIVKDPGGPGHIVFGGTYYWGLSVLLLFKINNAGVPQWCRMIEPATHAAFPMDMIPTSDGNVVTVSSFEWYSPFVNYKSMVAKVNSNGNEVWKTGIEVPGEDVRLQAAVEMPNGNIAVVGSLINGAGSQDRILVAFLDGGNGNLLGSFRYETPPSDNGGVSAYDVVPGPNGTLLIMGEYSGSQANGRILLIEVNANGTEEASVLSQGWGRNLERRSNGAYAITGTFRPLGMEDKACLIQLDTDGDHVSTHYYGELGERTRFNASREAANGDHMLFGTTEETGVINNEYDQFMVRTTSAGVSNCCGLGTVAQTQTTIDLVDLPDGAVTFVPDLTVHFDGLMPWATTDPLYHVAPICASKFAGVDLGEELAGELTVFPNPSQGQVTVRIPEELLQGDLMVVNALGQVVLRQPLTAHEATFDLSHLERGTYFVHVSKGDRRMTKRIVLQ